MNIGCDQVSKKIVRNSISDGEQIAVLKNNLILTRVENTGAAYSLGEGLHPWLKIIFLQLLPTVVLAILLVLVLVRRKYSKEIVLGFTFIIGGGIGNIFDRITQGSVTDFLYIDIGFFHTQIFNMADVSVVVGTLILVASALYKERNLQLM